MSSRIRIPVHVAAYGVALLPGIAYAYYWKENRQSDEDLEKILKENYLSKIQDSKEKKQEMVKFFDSMKNHSDPGQEQKMRQVLNGGRGDIKRHYAVDEKLYGTEEGAKMAEEAQKKRSSIVVANKKKQKKEKRQKPENMVTDRANENFNDASSHDRNTLLMSLEQKHMAAGIVALGVVGGVLSLFFGGKRTQ